MADFDLLIIGAGSGNSILSDEFEDWNVGIVERGVFGGTCLNAGCIPSKMLVLPADRMVEALEADERLGVDIRTGTADWPAIRDRVFSRIDPIAASGTDYRHSQDHVTVLEGSGRFIGMRTLRVTSSDGTHRDVTAERIVLAAGASPRIPPVPGLSTIAFHTSDSIMRIDRLPEHLVILGGGFIAAELGHVFSSLGSRVSVVHRGDRMLRHEDSEVSMRFTQSFCRRVEVYFDAYDMTVRPDGNGVTVAFEQRPRAGASTLGRTGTEVSGDVLLVTTGRDPNGAELDVGATGVELDADGYVVTDRHLATAAEGVWALGDIRNPLQLKHLANREAAVVSHNLLHPERLVAIDERVVPHAVFSHPQIGSVGATEMDLRNAGQLYLAGRCEYGAVAYGWALEDTTGFAKVLVDPASRQILGGHVIGPQAATLVQQLTQAMTFDIPADELARTQIWCHPALPEVIENALLDALD
jgi:mycothione reductase